MGVVSRVQTRRDLRKRPRKRLQYRANILIGEKGPLQPCSITDISQSGARLVLETDRELPQRFMLLLSSRGDARRVCRQVWRDGENVGVEFEVEPPEVRS
jgi:PilZ domain